MASRMLKHLFFLIVMTSLVACGGGDAQLGVDSTSGDTNSGEGATLGGDSGTGGDSFGGLDHCVSINRPAQNLRYSMNEVEYIANQSVSEGRVTYEILAFGDASSTIEITSSENSNTLISSSDFYIADNYRHITFTFDEEEDRFGDTILTHAIYFNPYRRFPDGEVCEGQSWEDAYTDRRESVDYGLQGAAQTNSLATKASIEGINIFKRVEAGEFNTYIVKLVDGSTEQRFWVDIESGAEVYSEVSLSGEIVNTSELTNIRY